MKPALLPDLLYRHAEARPDVPALASAGRQGLTYRAWRDRALTVAAALVEMNVAPGDRVALVGGTARYEEMGVAYMGALLAGAVALPLDSTQPDRMLQRALRTASPRVVVACDDAVATGASRRAIPIAELVAPARERLPSLRGDDPAEVLSTSGTTGLPRLVEASHASLARDFDAEPRLDGDPYWVLHALAPGTNVGQVALRSSLTVGNTLVALDTFDADEFLRLASALPMRGAILLPAMAAALAAAGRRRGWSSASVEAVVVTGAATPAETWRRLAAIFPRARLINSYSTAEAWPARTVSLVDPSRPGSVGRPLDDQAVEIRDDSGQRLRAFERGTVHLRDRTVAPRRYVDGSVSLVRQGWVATDDLGYVDDEGCLFVVDRKSDVIATGGHTVSTLEVESVLVEHPQVVDAAVVGLPHPTLGSYVAACVVGPSNLDLGDVGRLARERLARHAVPRLLQRRAALPRGPSGKVLKAILRDELVAHHGDLGTQPEGQAEAAIRTIWEDVLERPVPAIDSPFFALGGDSLSALLVVTRIRDELGEGADAEDLLAASTIAEQASVLAAAQPSDSIRFDCSPDIT